MNEGKCQCPATQGERSRHKIHITVGNGNRTLTKPQLTEACIRMAVTGSPVFERQLTQFIAGDVCNQLQVAAAANLCSGCVAGW